jgi:hypothetical protein
VAVIAGIGALLEGPSFLPVDCSSRLAAPDGFWQDSQGHACGLGRAVNFLIFSQLLRIKNRLSSNAKFNTFASTVQALKNEGF